MKKYDVIIIGAGAAGLSAARAVLARGRTVAVFDMGNMPARKVAVSGGGRCNFTNMAATYNRYFGANPEFARSCLALVSPSDILEWMNAHNLSYVQKSPGQYFCNHGADAVVDALVKDAKNADIILNTPITNIEKSKGGFVVYAQKDSWSATSVIIATGGISFANLDVSDFGYKIAKKFGHKIVSPEPGLVGLKTNAFDAELSGLSLFVKIIIGKKQILDSLMFTHFGISGPAAYRASLFGLSNDIVINFAPDTDALEWLKIAKTKHGKKSLASVLSLLLPTRLAKWFAGNDNKNIADYRDAELSVYAQRINHFVLSVGTLKRRGFDSAEVTLGGISTADVSSKTFESRLCSGLYFAGEVLDITGDLGGFNLHFAFASGTVAGNYAGKKI